MSEADLVPIVEEVVIAGRPEDVWPLIADPMAVVSCVPGAAITGQQEDGTFEAKITVKFGPTIATFTGEVRVAYDNANRTCTVNGRGIDQRGASRALVRAAVSIVEGPPTAAQSALSGRSSLMRVDGGFNVAGPLETFASAGGVHVARALLAEFAKNVAGVIRARQDAPPAGEPISAPATATELRAGNLLWRAFIGWLRQLFKKGKNHA